VESVEFPLKFGAGNSGSNFPDELFVFLEEVGVPKNEEAMEDERTPVETGQKAMTGKIGLPATRPSAVTGFKAAFA